MLAHDVVRHEYGFAVGLNEPPPRARGINTVHVHSDVELNFVLSGSVSYVMGGGVREITVDRLAVFWAGIPHGVVSAAPGTRYIWVTVPFATFLQWGLPEQVTGRLLAGDIIDAGDLADDETAEDRLMTARWLRTFRPADRAMLLEIEARIRRLAALVARVGPASVTGPGTGGQLERVAQYVSVHFREPISVSDIAKAVGLHRTYLMQVFKRACGMSVWEYVLRLRVSHGERLLLTTDLGVLDVALASGFASPSQFYAAFRRFVGTTPGDYRRAAAIRS